MNELTPYTPTFLTELERDPHLASRHTRRLYSSALTLFEAWREGRVLTKTLVEEYLAVMQANSKAPSTINAHLAAIRWWARRVAELAFENTSSEEAERIGNLANRITSVRDVTGSRIPAGRHLETSEIEHLLEACRADQTPAGSRDGALIALAVSTGARSDELLSIRLDDITYTNDGAEVLIRHGKGNKQRKSYLFGPALQAVDAWLEYRGAAPGYFVTRILKNGRVLLGDKLTYEGLRKILKKRFNESALPQAMTWHDFRRTFIGTLLDQDVDIATIQELVGHATPRQTAAYDRRPEERKREAVRGIQVPYKS